LIFTTVTLSFDWLAFVVKLVWLAAENCARTLLNVQRKTVLA